MSEWSCEPQVKGFNAQKFKEAADSAFHRDMVELAFQGFQQQLVQCGGQEELLRRDLLVRMEIVQKVQERLVR